LFQELTYAQGSHTYYPLNLTKINSNRNEKALILL
jgi:hypothetical protein